MKPALESQAIHTLKEGGVGVMLSDTVYGLVCRADNVAGVQRLYEAKEREGKPGTLLAASADAFLSLGIDKAALKQAGSFWPGPISVVVSCHRPNMEYLHCGKRSLALRVPRAESLRSFLRQTGPLLSSSANISNYPVAQSLEQAYDYFGERVDFYLQLALSSTGQASTVVAVSSSGQPRILREGSVSKDEIKQKRMESKHK